LKSFDQTIALEDYFVEAKRSEDGSRIFAAGPKIVVI
jgi:hypothetical protein